MAKEILGQTDNLSKHIKQKLETLAEMSCQKSEIASAEMVELIVHGYENIICTQPFGCLPTHVCGNCNLYKSFRVCRNGERRHGRDGAVTKYVEKKE